MWNISFIHIWLNICLISILGDILLIRYTLSILNFSIVKNIYGFDITILIINVIPY